MNEETNRQLFIKTKNEELRVTIPESWKVTFGPLSQRGYEDGNALRIYEAENKQRACFVNVVSFRDLSIPVEKKIKRVSKGKSSSADSSGNSLSSESIVVDDGDWIPA